MWVREAHLLEGSGLAKMDVKRIRAHFFQVFDENARHMDALRMLELDHDRVHEFIPMLNWWIAEAMNGQFLGLLGGQIRDELVGPIAVLESIYVAPQARDRRQTVGAALLDTFSAWAKDQGVSKMMASMRFRRIGRALERFGFQPVSMSLVRKV